MEQLIAEEEKKEEIKFVNEKALTLSQKKIASQASFVGLMGQDLFDGFLQQYMIPNCYANPIFKDKKMRQIEGKHYDFYIPCLPEDMRFVSIKTVPKAPYGKPMAIRFLANVESWENERHDIVVILRMLN
jgi:hypothetical protein